MCRSLPTFGQRQQCKHAGYGKAHQSEDFFQPRSYPPPPREPYSTPSSIIQVKKHRDKNTAHLHQERRRTFPYNSGGSSSSEGRSDDGRGRGAYSATAAAAGSEAGASVAVSTTLAGSAVSAGASACMNRWSHRIGHAQGALGRVKVGFLFFSLSFLV